MREQCCTNKSKFHFKSPETESEIVVILKSPAVLMAKRPVETDSKQETLKLKLRKLMRKGEKDMRWKLIRPTIQKMVDEVTPSRVKQVFEEARSNAQENVFNENEVYAQEEIDLAKRVTELEKVEDELRRSYEEPTEMYQLVSKENAGNIEGSCGNESGRKEMPVVSVEETEEKLEEIVLSEDRKATANYRNEKTKDSVIIK